jgi:hypothetical protein
MRNRVSASLTSRATKSASGLENLRMPTLTRSRAFVSHWGVFGRSLAVSGDAMLDAAAVVTAVVGSVGPALISPPSAPSLLPVVALAAGHSALTLRNKWDVTSV